MLLNRAGALLVALLLASTVTSTFGSAQRRDAARGEGPAVEIVHTVGCAERRGSDTDWWLVRAAEPETTQAGVFNVPEVDAAKERPLGDREFRLVGVPEFVGAEALLRAADRAAFTDPDQVNATGELRDGRTVLVKALLIEAEPAPHLNLLAVVGLADACGAE